MFRFSRWEVIANFIHQHVPTSNKNAKDVLHKAKELQKNGNKICVKVETLKKIIYIYLKFWWIDWKYVFIEITTYIHVGHLLWWTLMKTYSFCIAVTFFQCKSENLHTFSLVFILDVFLKQNADKKAFENFEKNVKSANVQANPKEGVVSERFESKYMVWRVKCISVL